MTLLPTDFDTLLQSLLNRYPNTPIELLYHPDADPGNGSGWAVTVADRTVTGGLVEAIRMHLQEVSNG